MNADSNSTAQKPAESPDQEPAEAETQEAEAPSKRPAAEKGKKRTAEKKPKKPAQKKADAEAEGMRDRMLRLQADFENFRRRTQREREELYRMANEDILAEILPVLDHFELAIQAGQENENSAALLEGVRLVWDQLNASLAKFHLISSRSKPMASNLIPTCTRHYRRSLRMRSQKIMFSCSIAAATCSAINCCGRRRS